MAAKWSHRQAEVRAALDEAVKAGLSVRDTLGHHGHSWGYIDCPDLDCTDHLGRYYVNSTPRSAGDEANRIRRFIRRHQHKEDCAGGEGHGRDDGTASSYDHV